MKASRVLTSLLAAVVLHTLPTEPAGAQDLFAPRPAERVPQVPDKAAPAQQRFHNASSFVDSLSKRDGMFEVIVGQGRLLTTSEDIAGEGNTGVVAVGDPSILDFVVIGPRHIRLVGRRIGVTDLAVTTGDHRTFSFEVHVVIDLDYLRARLRSMFPDASLKLGQMREHVVVEGQARDTRQVGQIIQTIEAYLQSVQVPQQIEGQGQGQGQGGSSGPGGEAGAPAPKPPSGDQEAPEQEPRVVTYPERRPDIRSRATVPPSQVINLIQVPGPQQVLLKVQVAELNRTALREIGVDWKLADGNVQLGNVIGSQLGEISRESGGILQTITGIPTSTTGFAIFDAGDFQFLISALRQNSLLKILAEPNLVTMNGQPADFHAGGEFPVIVPQSFGGGAAAGTFTVQFKQFGVKLAFLPYILDDERIRMSVDPEVSAVDFSVAATLVPGASPTPGINTRRVHSVVELREGQTLAIAGLLQYQQDGNTRRIPALGDLPYVGALFSNNRSRVEEKELIVLVTPHLIEAMNPDQVPPLPGSDVTEPDDHEFYLLNRMEGRKDRPFRSTSRWDDPLGVRRRIQEHRQHVRGVHGYSD